MKIYKVGTEQLMRVYLETEVEASSEAEAKEIVMAYIKDNGSTDDFGDIVEIEHAYDDPCCHDVEEVKAAA